MNEVIKMVDNLENLRAKVRNAEEEINEKLAEKLRCGNQVSLDEVMHIVHEHINPDTPVCVFCKHEATSHIPYAEPCLNCEVFRNYATCFEKKEAFHDECIYPGHPDYPEWKKDSIPWEYM